MKNLSTLNSLFVYLFFLVLISSFTNCSDKEKNEIRLETDKSEIALSADAPKTKFRIIATGEWNIEAEGLSATFGPNVGSTDWYEVSPMYGKGNTKVSIQSKGVVGEKQTVLLIKSGKIQKQLVLKQK